MWNLIWDPDVLKALKKMDRSTKQRIVDYMEKKVVPLEDPKVRGKGLQHELLGLWRYRVGDYRVICKIIDSEIEIIVVHADHRKKVYKGLSLSPSSAEDE